MSLIMPGYIQRDPDYYVTDFSEYTVGVQPPDWTKQWTTTHYTATVQSVVGSLSGKALQIGVTTTGTGMFSWNRVPLAADIEILTRGRVITSPLGANNPFTRIGARGFAGENAYNAMPLYSTAALYDWYYQVSKRVAGVSNQVINLADAPAPLIANVSPSIWIWCRFRLIGTSIAIKVWQDGQAEPGSFTAATTDSTFTAGGWVGEYIDTGGASSRQIDFFSVALKGKTAPSAKR